MSLIATGVTMIDWWLLQPVQTRDSPGGNVHMQFSFGYQVLGWMWRFFVDVLDFCRAEVTLFPRLLPLSNIRLGHADLESCKLALTEMPVSKASRACLTQRTRDTNTLH